MKTVVFRGLYLYLKIKKQYSKGPRASAIPTSLPKGKYVIFFDAKAQTISILEKSKTTLVEKGLKMADIFLLRLYLTPDVKTVAFDFDVWNTYYKQYLMHLNIQTNYLRLIL
jgi:enamine deaminase RidA (YjgF/YER057c/UK114 family)